MSEGSISASAEWRAHWPKVGSAMVGMSFYAMLTYHFGLFIQPLQAEFGWDRWQYFYGQRWLQDNEVRNIWVDESGATRKVWIRTRTGTRLILLSCIGVEVAPVKRYKVTAVPFPGELRPRYQHAPPAIQFY